MQDDRQTKPAYHEHDQSSAPELSFASSSQFPEVVVEENFPILDLKAHGANKEVAVPQPTPATSLWKRRRTSIVALVLLVIVTALAAGLGGYFSVRARSRTKSSSNSADPATAGTDVGNSSTTPHGNFSDALNGTSFASLSYDPTAEYNGDTQQQNYVLFYQQVNGDIRKIIYNESAWLPSEYVTSDARMGTGLSAVWFGKPPVQIYIYYIDKAGILQELRSEHASSTWNNGTIGGANFKAIDSYSALSAQFQGQCDARGMQLGWVFYESAQGVQEARWHYDNDTWVIGNRFQNIRPGSGFISTIAGGPIKAWRLFGIRKDLVVQEYACEDCCGNSTQKWELGINASVTSNSTLGIAATTHTGSRMLYYQDLNATIHELNNTDFNSARGSLSEGWVSYASTDAKKGNTSSKAVADARGLDVAQAMPGTKMSVVMGFRGKTNQIFLFYQQNGSDITVLVRDERNIGGWDGGKALELGV